VKERRGHALIIGGSISGLFAAAYLQKAGFEVDVFERTEVELSGRGAGIATHDELIQILEDCGAGTHELGVEVTHRVTLDRDGGILEKTPLRQVMTSWDRIHRLMRPLVPEGRYHLSKDVVSVTQNSDRVTARFTDGTEAEGDILIAADGFRSAVRRQIAPEVEPEYAGYVVWRGVAEESAFSARTHDILFPHFLFYLPRGHQIIVYPIAGADNDLRPGHRRLNLVWYERADDGRVTDILTDADGTLHPISIAPPLIRDEVIADMRATAEALMPQPLRDVVDAVERPFFQPIYDLASPQMAYGRIAVIGDAAFVARPHAGFGVTKAAGDARVLAECLAAHGGDIGPGLAAFEARRRPIGERVVHRGRELGTYMGVDLKTEADRALHERLQSPQVLMAETAVSHFLHE